MFGYKNGKIDTPAAVSTTTTRYYVSPTLYDHISRQPSNMIRTKSGLTIRCHTTCVDSWDLINKEPRLTLSERWRGGNIHVEIHSNAKVAIAENFVMISDAFYEIVRDYEAQALPFTKLHYVGGNGNMPTGALFGSNQSKDVKAVINTQQFMSFYVSLALFRFLELQPSSSFTAKNGITLMTINGQSTNYSNHPDILVLKRDTWNGKTVDFLNGTFNGSLKDALIRDYDKIKDAFLEMAEACKGFKIPELEGMIMTSF